jgi:dehydrodolichyl diphosphate syntase complex subunit NUS1
MMVSKQDTELFRQDIRFRGAKLSAAERERLVKPYLPDPSALPSSTTLRARRQKKTPIRTFLKSNLHQLVYACIHLFFGLYIRISHSINAVIDKILAIIYYHHRTPELIQKDVRGLSRLPEHLSVLLTLRKDDEALQTLMDEVAELAAWSSCASIPTLSVYEKSGTFVFFIVLLYV